MKIKVRGDTDLYVIVDDEDFGYLNRFKWYLHNNGYVIKNGGHHRYMHRLVVDARKGQEIDHINHNKLDNRKINLRFVGRTDNNLNQLIRRDNKSGYKNIYFDKDRNKWLMQVYRHGKRLTLKRFNTIDEAVKARNDFIEKL